MDALAELPTFTPTPGSGSGLDLLAAAAAKDGWVDDASGRNTGITPLSKMGPFNPAATLAPKVAKKVLGLEFVEMSEVTMDAPPEPTPSRPLQPSRPMITDISHWVERYATMAALLTTRFPHKAPELLAYLATIVRAERNYEPGRWVAYDRQFRREALAKKCLDWSVPDARLYSEAFTGRARSIPRCSLCLQDDHQANVCPQNRDQPWWVWPFGSGPAGPPQGNQGTLPRTPRKAADVCRRFNEGRCRLPSCRYVHACKECGGDHPSMHCGRTRPRARSPHRPTAPPSQGQSTGWTRR